MSIVIILNLYFVKYRYKKLVQMLVQNFQSGTKNFVQIYPKSKKKPAVFCGFYTKIGGFLGLVETERLTTLLYIVSKSLKINYML